MISRVLRPASECVCVCVCVRVCVTRRTSGLEWSGTPQSANSPAQYGFKLDGVRQISQICMQNLPNQPPGTCMIQLRDAASCFK